MADFWPNCPVFTLKVTFASVVVLSLAACGKGPAAAAAEAGPAAKADDDPSSAENAAGDRAPEGDKAGVDGAPAGDKAPEPSAPTADKTAPALSEATLASSAQCEGDAGCVPEAVLALIRAHAKEASETTGEHGGLTLTLTTGSDGLSLHWLSYHLPITDEGAQFDRLECRTAIEVLEGAPPREIFHRCQAECILGGQLVDLFGGDMPELVTYCGPAHTGGLGNLDIYGVTTTGWAKLTTYTSPCDQDDPEGESHYQFSREGIELRCHTLDDAGETVINPPVQLRWTGSEFTATQ